jgi:phage terminase small subunit
VAKMAVEKVPKDKKRRVEAQIGEIRKVRGIKVKEGELKLTHKEEIFANEYLIDYNAYRAYKVAFPKYNSPEYKEVSIRKNASDLSLKPSVKAYIDARKFNILNALDTKVKVDTEFLVNNLLNCLNKSLKEEEIKDKDGNGTGKFVYDSKGALKALELLGKLKTVDAYVTGNTNIQVNNNKLVVFANDSDLKD